MAISSIRKFIFLILGSFIFAGLLTIASASTATSAFAADCISASKSPCYNQAISWTGGSGGGGGGQGFGDSGSSESSSGLAQPKPIPKVCAANSSYYPVPISTWDYQPTYYPCNIPQYISNTYYDPFPEDNIGDAVCPVKTISGFKVKPVGVYNTTVHTLISLFWVHGVGWQKTYSYGETTWLCVYPKLTTTSKTVDCAVSASIQMIRTKVSRAGTEKQVDSASQNYATPSQIENDSSKCKTSASLNLGYTAPSSPQAWGQYKIPGTIKYTTCQRATTSIDGNTKVVYNCGGVKQGPSELKKLTIWCKGISQSWILKSWTGADCRGGAGYACSVPNKAQYDGKTGTVQTLRDGKERKLQWGIPKATGGVRAVKNWDSITHILSGSTPYNNEVSANSKNQFFHYSEKIGSWNYMGAANASTTAEKIGFYTASNPGRPFQMQREYRFDAQFLAKQATVRSYNPFTGSIQTSLRDIWVPDTNIDCASQLSPKMEAIRSIGDSQNF